MPARRPLAVLFAGLALVAVFSAPRSPAARAAAAPPFAERGFDVVVIAHVTQARELAIAPNGDALVGTLRGDVELVPDSEGPSPGQPRPFAHLGDPPAAGVALGPEALYVGTQHAVWKLPYRPGDQRPAEAPEKLLGVRPGNGDDHVTTTVALAGSKLYASVGSSCNACSESDPTRATIQELSPDGKDAHAKAVHIRNAIGLAVNPATGNVWAAVAGQDELAHGHPYEIFDPFTLHAGTPNYGWPTCYEDHRPARPGAECAQQTVARVVMPAYATPIGAVFYPLHPTGRYAFPSAYRGGAFVTLHGSWHTPPVAPRVVFVPMHGDEPATPVDWQNPDRQWSPFLTGFQNADSSRIGRPTGIAVGPQGSLFVADDDAGVIYRIRPTRSNGALGRP